MNEIQKVNQNNAVATVHDIGQVANGVASQHVFSNYLLKVSKNTVRAQLSDLETFSQFLSLAGIVQDAVTLQSSPDAWQGITWGIVQSFVRWMLQQGYAIASVNRKLSTVKKYSKLASQGGSIDVPELVLIRNVEGYSRKAAINADEQRPVTRIGRKKAEHVSIELKQAQQLIRKQPDTPQGRRDAVLMALLLEHGLRCGEVALLQATDFDLKKKTFTFYRPKVNMEQTHRMTPDTLWSIREWIESGDCPAMGPLLRGYRKGGALTQAGMSVQAITARVRVLGKSIGIEGLSAHDCRHYWATRATEAGTDAFALRDAGGWSSLAMPSRYVEAATIANERVKLG